MLETGLVSADAALGNKQGFQWRHSFSEILVLVRLLQLRTQSAYWIWVRVYSLG